ncbi:MAG: hypothetical protein ABIB61_02775 [Candidatus Shapirobacteria bacterium]
MVYYIHGDNTFGSRQKLNSTRESFLAQNPSGKMVLISCKGFSCSDLRAKQANLSFIERKELFLVENLRKFKKDQEKELFNILLKSKANVIFWDDQLTSRFRNILKFFPQAQEFKFPLPRLTFKFLESVFPQNQKQLFGFWRELAELQPTELSFYFLKKHFHNLILAMSFKSNFPDWQKAKLVTQAKKLSCKKTIDIYIKLIELEYKQKKGLLSAGLEIPLVNLLASL